MSVPFEILDVQLLDNGQHRVKWKTIADDGSPEVAMEDIEVPASIGVTEYIDALLQEKKSMREEINARAAAEREAEPEEPTETRQSPVLSTLQRRAADRGWEPVPEQNNQALE